MPKKRIGMKQSAIQEVKMTKKQKLKMEQDKTIKDAKEKLEEKHKVAILRCTGFGKTTLATGLISDYKKVLYIYPAEVIKDDVENRYEKNQKDKKNQDDLMDQEDEIGPDEETIKTSRAMSKIPNCTMMTYMKLALLKTDDIAELLKEKYDLIIFDEAHRMGGRKAKFNIERILSGLKGNTHYIGLTATPIRTDGMDIASMFFNNVTVYPYSIVDAINDGLIKSPNYVFCPYDTKGASNKLVEAALTVGKEIGDDPERYNIFKAKVLETAKIDTASMRENIKKYCDKFTDTNYMKFIVFFSSIKHMDDKLPDVVRWFKQAYPTHKVNVLRISSKNSQEGNNVKGRLDKLKKADNTIHIIAAIDKVNMGYHVDDISGIIMYRGTSSNIIFVQQFGRALSVNSKKRALIIDIVDNIHRKAVFDIRPSYCKRKNGKYLTDYQLDKNNNLVVYDVHNGVYIPTNYHMDDDNNIVDENGDITELEYNEENGKIYEIGDITKKSKNPNAITEKCLKTRAGVASEREKIAKLEAEILAFKCHWVLETHFRAWCINNHILYPISNKELKLFYGKDKKEFYRWFLDLLKRKKIDYPFNDIEKLLHVGDDDYNTPLKICAEMKNISVSKVLDELGIA